MQKVSQNNLRPSKEIERIGKYKINHSLEQIIAKGNEALAVVEEELIQKAIPSTYPLIIICYPPRSGSTLLAQLMAGSKLFNYVTNFIARFWDAPYFAGLIEKELSLRSMKFPNKFSSYFGVTNCANEPHEFGFFWNKWLLYRLPFLKGSHRIDYNNLFEQNLDSFKKEIYSLISLYEQPFFIKNGYTGLNPAFFYKVFKNVRFIVVKRNPVYIAQSIYNSRIKLYGNEKYFWSTRPSSYKEICKLPVSFQIAYQIKGIYDDIYYDIKKINANFIEIFYEDLCKNHEEELQKIFQFANINNNINWSFIKRYKFGYNRVYLQKKIFKEIENAVKEVFNDEWFQKL